MIVFDRFKELDNFLDLTVLQMKQGITESMGDYLSRVVKQDIVKNIPENILLSAAINGMKNKIKSLVITHKPNTMEKLRQVALLAEKSQISALETYETLLAEIKQINDTVKSDIHVLENGSDINTLDQGVQPYYQPSGFQQSVVHQCIALCVGLDALLLKQCTE
jgi:hypothetical protein